MTSSWLKSQCLLFSRRWLKKLTHSGGTWNRRPTKLNSIGLLHSEQKKAFVTIKQSLARKKLSLRTLTSFRQPFDFHTDASDLQVVNLTERTPPCIFLPQAKCRSKETIQSPRKNYSQSLKYWIHIAASYSATKFESTPTDRAHFWWRNSSDRGANLRCLWHKWWLLDHGSSPTYISKRYIH